MCTVLLPPGGHPFAVKYVISYQLCWTLSYIVQVWSTHDVSGFRRLLILYCVFLSGCQITLFFHSRLTVFRGQCGRLKNSVCSNIAVSSLELVQSLTTCLKIGLKSYGNYTVYKFVWVLYCLTLFQALLKQKPSTVLRYSRSHKVERSNLKQSISFHKN
jgi:hypothetical protein